VAVPDAAESFPGLDQSRLRLRTVALGSRHGFIWAQLSGTATSSLDLAGYLGGADADLQSYDFDSYTYYRGTTERRMFNWKTCIEGFLENYHFSTLHKKSTNRIFLNNVAVVDNLGIHIRAVAPKRTVASLSASDRGSWRLREHATLLYVLFPNTCVFVEKKHISVLRVIPDGPAASLVHISHLVASADLKLRDFWDTNIDIFMSAVNEDLAICESMTRGMAGSYADDEIQFGRNEGACARFRQVVDACLTDPGFGRTGMLPSIDAEVALS
jgi:phenylpropionate dioxygenase-like ring-hydroxylating dioxygenase large terminal subunit